MDVLEFHEIHVILPGIPSLLRPCYPAVSNLFSSLSFSLRQFCYQILLPAWVALFFIPTVSSLVQPFITLSGSLQRLLTGVPTSPFSSSFFKYRELKYDQGLGVCLHRSFQSPLPHSLCHTKRGVSVALSTCVLTLSST